MGEPKYSAEKVIEAIKGTGGVKTKIARKLNVKRDTVSAYIERWPTVKEAYESERATVDDVAESVVINDIITNQNVSTAMWWLRMKRSDEFAPQVDVTVKGYTTRANPDDWPDDSPDKPQ